MKLKNVMDRFQVKTKFPALRVGDTVRVHVRIEEGEKQRIQVFEGTIIRRKRGAGVASFTVRKVSYGVGVERIFPMQSPAIAKIEILQRGKARRSRLYFLRQRRGKRSALETTAYTDPGAELATEKVESSPAEPSEVRSIAAP